MLMTNYSSKKEMADEKSKWIKKLKEEVTSNCQFPVNFATPTTVTSRLETVQKNVTKIQDKYKVLERGIRDVMLGNQGASALQANLLQKNRFVVSAGTLDQALDFIKRFEETCPSFVTDFQRELSETKSKSENKMNERLQKCLSMYRFLRVLKKEIVNYADYQEKERNLPSFLKLQRNVQIWKSELADLIKSFEQSLEALHLAIFKQHSEVEGVLQKLLEIAQSCENRYNLLTTLGD